MRLEKGIYERRKRGALGKNNNHAEQQQDHHDRGQPPFFLVAQELPELEQDTHLWHWITPFRVDSLDLDIGKYLNLQESIQLIISNLSPWFRSLLILYFVDKTEPTRPTLFI